jgi:hypothetical protein
LRRRNKILLAISSLLLLVIVGFVIWAETPLGPMPEADGALIPNTEVDVAQSQWLIFSPHGLKTTTGFIIYPGGRVNPKSYSPLAQMIAAKGFLVAIVPMPLNLAVLGSNRAEEILKAYPNIKFWAIGGHSLGGTIAARFAYRNPSKTQGLVLWAAYPASGDNLSNTHIATLTIHGTNDGLVSASQIDNSMKFLPLDAIRLEIMGGNHAQFGWYGNQAGDNTATISREVQQEQVAEATFRLLKEISSP